MILSHTVHNSLPLSVVWTTQIIFSPTSSEHNGHEGGRGEGRGGGGGGGRESNKHTSPKAIGVEFEMNGVIHHAYLNRHFFETDDTILDAYGVILTAGAIHTPKILLNSGIGPAKEVDELGGGTSSVPLQQDSPGVGKNLQDHPTVNVKFQINNFCTAGMQARWGILYLVTTANPVSMLLILILILIFVFPEIPSAFDLVKTWRQYHLATQSGRAGGSGGGEVPLAAFGVLGTPGFSSGAFLRSPLCRTADPDIQVTFFPSVSILIKQLLCCEKEALQQFLKMCCWLY